MFLLLPPWALAAPPGVDDLGMWLFNLGANANSLVQARLSGGLSPATLGVILVGVIHYASLMV